jgi:hypothetical protein
MIAAWAALGGPNKPRSCSVRTGDHQASDVMPSRYFDADLESRAGGVDCETERVGVLNGRLPGIRSLTGADHNGDERENPGKRLLPLVTRSFLPLRPLAGSVRALLGVVECGPPSAGDPRRPNPWWWCPHSRLKVKARLTSVARRSPTGAIWPVACVYPLAEVEGPIGNRAGRKVLAVIAGDGCTRIIGAIEMAAAGVQVVLSTPSTPNFPVAMGLLLVVRGQIV